MAELDISRRVLGNIDGGSNFATYAFPVANGVTVTQGDFVYFSGGFITNATINQARPIGICVDTETGNAAGTVTSLVAIDDDLKYLLRTDGSGTFNATSVGKYFGLTGTTGNQKVLGTSSASTTGALICLEYNPQIDPVKTDTTYGVFMLVNSALDPYVAG